MGCYKLARLVEQAHVQDALRAGIPDTDVILIQISIIAFVGTARDGAANITRTDVD